MTEDIEEAVGAGKVAVVDVKLASRSSQALRLKWCRKIAPACVFFHGVTLEFPYEETESGTNYEDWIKKCDAIFKLRIGPSQEIKLLANLNGMGMEQLGLLSSYYYLTDAKYADKFQMERTKYLGKWKVKDRLPGNDAGIDGIDLCYDAIDDNKRKNKSEMRPPGAFRLKKAKEENDIAERVKADMFGGNGGHVSGGGGGVHVVLGAALKELVGMAQTTMLLSIGGHDQPSASGLREEMMKSAMLKLQGENLDAQLAIQRKQMAVNDLAAQLGRANSATLPVTPVATDWGTPAATRAPSGVQDLATTDNSSQGFNAEIFDSDSE